MKPQFYYYLAFSGYVGLLLLLLFWQIIVSPAHSLPAILILLLITLMPLLIPLKGLLNADLKSTAWAAYVSLIYFTHGIGEAYSNVNERLLAGLEIFFSLLLFFGACFYVRFSGRAKKL